MIITAGRPLRASRRPRLAAHAALAVALAFAFALLLAGPASAETRELDFTIPAPVQMAPYGVTQGLALAPSPDVDGYVTGMSADVVDANGATMDVRRVMLHHIVFVKVGAPDSTCSTFQGIGGAGAAELPAGIMAQRFYAEGEERAKLVLPAPYGYPNRGTDRWGVLYMLMNHTNRGAQARIRFHVTYVVGEERRPVVPYWFDVRNCRADPVFDAPGTGGPGSTMTASSTFRMPSAGRIVAASGHVHGGARTLDLEDRSRPAGQRDVLALRPRWGLPGSLPYKVKPVLHEPGPIHMTRISSVEGIPFSAGAPMRLTATYDNARLHTRNMGILVAMVAPDDAATSAAPMPADVVRVERPEPDVAALYGQGYAGRAPTITVPLFSKPDGPLTVDPTAPLRLGDTFFAKRRIEITAGATLRWRWSTMLSHNVTVASGPVGFSSTSTTRGAFSERFTRPGVYKLYCALHPAYMTAEVRVLARRQARARHA